MVRTHQRLDARHDGAGDGGNDLAQLADATKDSDHPEHPQDPKSLYRPALHSRVMM